MKKRFFKKSFRIFFEKSKNFKIKVKSILFDLLLYFAWEVVWFCYRGIVIRNRLSSRSYLHFPDSRHSRTVRTGASTCCKPSVQSAHDMVLCWFLACKCPSLERRTPAIVWNDNIFPSHSNYFSHLRMHRLKHSSFERKLFSFPPQPVKLNGRHSCVKVLK